MKKIAKSWRSSVVGSVLVGAAWVASAQGLVELNFNDARIDSVAAAVGAMVGKNVVVDPKVKGNLTLISDQGVSPQQALSQLQAALRMHGFAMIDAGAVFKVVLDADAKTYASKVNASVAGSDVQTRVFTLHHENATNVLGVLKPLVSPNNVVNVNPGTNAIVVTDYADNLQRIGRLIAALDRSHSTELEIIALEHAIATEMVPLLQRLMDSSHTASGAVKDMPATSLQTTLMADSRSNALIVRAANASKLAQVRSLVARLDQPSIQNDASVGNIHVIYLRHADALSLAETLRAAIKTIEQAAPAAAIAPNNGSLPNISSNTIPMPSPLPAGGVTGLAAAVESGGGLGNTKPLSLGQNQMPSVGGQVQADPNTNSLIITAPAPLFRQLRAVIDKLDSRRAQVLVESMIVEVSDNKLAEFGVQWQAAIGAKGSAMGAIGTNSGLVGGNILNVAASLASGDSAAMANALSSLGGGLNLALAPRALGQYYLGALANFLQQDGSTNILSKPNLMTLDNQEARIIIGNNVPFVTGSYATTGSSSTVNPFTTVERKDVGLMLRIRPTINENGTVKLTVNQEASSIDTGTLNNQNGPSTSKRSIESTVLVDDGSIVMLGGLMQDSFSSTADKVPLLGDIPVVGNLFKSENRTRRKTNLMVFLRPVVMRDASATESMAISRYEEIRAQQHQLQPLPSIAMGNVSVAPVSPAFYAPSDHVVPTVVQPVAQPSLAAPL